MSAYLHGGAGGGPDLQARQVALLDEFAQGLELEHKFSDSLPPRLNTALTARPYLRRLHLSDLLSYTPLTRL